MIDRKTLSKAATFGDIAVVRAALVEGCDLNARNVIGKTLLMSAAASGHTEIVRLLLDSGADPNIPDDIGMTPLLMATQRQSHDAVTMLLQHGARVDACDPAGNTPLHKAVLHCVAPEDEAMVWELVSSGADPHARNKSGVKPVALAQAIAGNRVAETLGKYERPMFG